jgi:hypothetical protein
MTFEYELMELQEENKTIKKDLEKLSELQIRHEHQDELRAVKQDQLMSNMQSFMNDLKEYQKELHEVTLKNTEDIVVLDKNHARASVKLSILLAILGAVGAAFLGAAFTWLPSLIKLISKGN